MPSVDRSDGPSMPELLGAVDASDVVNTAVPMDLRRLAKLKNALVFTDRRRDCCCCVEDKTSILLRDLGSLLDASVAGLLRKASDECSATVEALSFRSFRRGKNIPIDFRIQPLLSNETY